MIYNSNIGQNKRNHTKKVIFTSLKCYEIIKMTCYIRVAVYFVLFEKMFICIYCNPCNLKR